MIGALLLACSGHGTGGPLVLHGVVRDLSGRPVAEARIAIVQAPVQMADIAALTGDDGRFSVTVPVAGTYRVAAFGEEGAADGSVHVGPGDRAFVELVMRR